MTCGHLICNDLDTVWATLTVLAAAFGFLWEPFVRFFLKPRSDLDAAEVP